MRTATHPSQGHRLRVFHWAALALLPTLGSAQTALLNDTGQTQCYDGSALVACTATNTGNAATYPGQDGRFGRDAAQTAGTLSKTGGGAAGFDFTALDASGNPNNGTGAPGGHACVRDNVTGLTWEVKQTDADTQPRFAGHTYTWYDNTRPSDQGSTGSNTCNGTLPGNLCNTRAYVAAVNTDGLCGQIGWRLPTRRELLSIVHNGRSSYPNIDTTYFPDVGAAWSNWYWWTSDTYVPVPASAWYVYFSDGYSNAYGKTNTNSVRLVRSGQ